ncbi:MAG TPA: glutaredoxin family protein [Lacipirellulaceae bacterium]|nr:glutaredoxin family protein [Lacipirellulaceae bacterium]
MGSNQRLQVVLYTRQHCPLCEEAREVLDAFRIAPIVVDIDTDENVRKRFDTCVPVVEIEGRVRFRGQVNPRLLRRILSNRG